VVFVVLCLVQLGLFNAVQRQSGVPQRARFACRALHCGATSGRSIRKLCLNLRCIDMRKRDAERQG
jgi:hypothetical protein